MKFFIFICILTLFSVHGQVAVTYDNKQYEACTSDSVEVTWDGYHNLQETTQSGFSSCSQNEYIGSELVSYKSSNYKQTLNIGASEGSTRYFVCALHCGSSKKFKIHCSTSDSANDDPLVTTTATPVTSTTAKPSSASCTTVYLGQALLTLFFLGILTH